MKKTLTLLSFVLAALVGLQASAAVYILGVGPDGKGNAWDPADPFEMTNTGGDIYTATLEPSQSIWFSFATSKGTWDEIVSGRIAAPSNNYDLNSHMGEEIQCGAMGANVNNAFQLTNPEGKYVVTLNLATRVMKIEGQTVVIPDPEDEGEVYIIGTVAGGWAPDAGLQMDTEDHKIYTAELSAEDDEYFSFTRALGMSWDKIAPFRFGTVETADYIVTDDVLGTEIPLAANVDPKAFVISAGEYLLTLNKEAMTLVITSNSDPIVPKEPVSVYVLGNVDGAGFAPNVGTELSTTDKVAYTGNIFVSDAWEGKGWIGFTRALADLEGDRGYKQIEAVRFGAADGLNDEYNYVVSELGKAIPVTYDSNASFELATGYYAITVDLNAMTVKFEAGVEPDPQLFILGEIAPVDGWYPENGVEMTLVEGKKFTANVTATGSNNGVTYFSFTTKLAAHDAENGGWNEIAAFRYGAPVAKNAENNYVIGDEDFNVNITLGKADDPIGFQIEPGDYKFTVDLEALTLKIEKGGNSLDVNGDGEINVGDVNYVLNIVLAEKYDAAADVNGDGSVNVGDVNTVLNAILK